MRSSRSMLTAMTFSKEQEERLLNSAPSTAAARAWACEVDLRRTIANIRLTPQQRLEQLEDQRALVAQRRSATCEWAERNERVKMTDRPAPSIPE